MINILFPLLCSSRLCRLRIKCVPKLSVLISNFYYSTNIIFNSSKKLSMSKVSGNMEMNIFVGKTDRFNGVTIHSDIENCKDVNEFSKKLEDSLTYWKTSGKRGIWFKVHLNQSEWIPILVKNGFKFHHAKEEFVMMYLWLPEEEHCNIPHYAHTLIGVGAVVVNGDDQVLVVRERYTILNRPFWKLPGGYVEPGENMVDAAIREVLEETSISTEFQSVLTIRHTHGSMFNCSDIYTVVSLKALSENIEKCERELAECKWMDIDEYMSHSDVHDLNKFFVEKYREYNRHNIKVHCLSGIHPAINKPYTLYSVTPKTNPDENSGVKEDNTSENDS